MERLAVPEEVVEDLRRGGALETEHRREMRLDPRDPIADGDLTAQGGLQPLGGRQVIGVHVGLKLPRHLKASVIHEVPDRLRGLSGCAPGRRVEVEDAVDDRACAGAAVAHHMARRAGLGIEEGGDDRTSERIAPRRVQHAVCGLPRTVMSCAQQ